MLIATKLILPAASALALAVVGCGDLAASAASAVVGAGAPASVGASASVVTGAAEALTALTGSIAVVASNISGEHGGSCGSSSGEVPLVGGRAEGSSASVEIDTNSVTTTMRRPGT